MAMVNFGIPGDLRDRLNELAETEGSSVNAEQLHLARRAVEEDEHRSAQGA